MDSQILGELFSIIYVNRLDRWFNIAFFQNGNNRAACLNIFRRTNYLVVIVIGNAVTTSESVKGAYRGETTGKFS